MPRNLGSMAPQLSLPRIEALHVANHRALRPVNLADPTPLTVLAGPNGSGKSTVSDALSFLSDCFRIGRRDALMRAAAA